MTPSHLPADHGARLERARLSLDGLSVGDAFGSQFFLGPVYEAHFAPRTMPPGPWRYTDDTEMALGIFEVLERLGCIDQYELAVGFARRYHNDMYRGYGPAAHGILSAIHQGTPWRNVAHAAFGGQGSMGNGAAMRVAPLGAYFASDLGAAGQQARASAEVTHAHPEGLAGAVAVAVAAAWACGQRGQFPGGAGGRLLSAVLERTPPGPTRDGITRALDLSPETTAERAGEALGNGSRVTAPDTVPFCLWCADRHLGDYPAALWAVIEAGGDVDTTGAIVGGVVALAAVTTIPQAWLAAREPLDLSGGRAWEAVRGAPFTLVADWRRMVMAKKTTCPITRADFRTKAKPVTITIGTQQMEVEPKEFSTGSLGWYLNGKTTIEVDGVRVQVQIGLNLTIVGSKELPEDESAPAAPAPSAPPAQSAE